jgi:hypothetical protein
LSDPTADAHFLVRDEDLRRLWNALDRARQVHRECLRGRQDSVLEMVTRVDVLGALEDFIGALDARKVPVPPRLQREVKILQNLTRYRTAHRRPVPTSPK